MFKLQYTKDDFIIDDVKGSKNNLEDSYSLYLSDVIYRPLTNEEEKHICDAIELGDEETKRKAKEILYLTNLRLVIKAANSYKGRGLDFLDLIQEGNLGLIGIIERFKPKMGYKFSTFAMGSIKNLIIRALDNKSRTIRIPVYLVQDVSKVVSIKNDLEQELLREVTAKDILKVLNVNKKEIQTWKHLISKTETMDKIINTSNKKIDNKDIKNIEDELVIVSKLVFDKVMGSIKKFYNKDFKIPSVTSIYEDINYSENDIERLLSYNDSLVSLNKKTTTNTSDTEMDELGTLIADNNDNYGGVEDLVISEDVDALLDELPERTARIIRLRFGFVDNKTRTYGEIGEELGISKEWVRQVITNQLANPLFQRKLLTIMGYKIEGKNEDAKIIEI